MTALLGYFTLSILFSFLCSIWEAVLLSVTPSYIKRKETEDPAVGKLLVRFKEDIDKPLSAILTLNTIAHTVGAIGVGAEAGKLYANKVLNVGFNLPYESIVATLMTLAILFVSEIIPKTLGANNWQTLAPISAKGINSLMWILKPFIWLSNQLTKRLQKDKGKSVFSKQDFAAMTDIANESGQIAERDSILIKNVLKFDELTAKDVMTPRTVLKIEDGKTTLNEYYEKVKGQNTYSRIPIYNESRDNIIGLVLKDELLESIVDGKGDQKLNSIKRDISVVDMEMSLRKVFDSFHESRAHLAIVMNQYGGVQGIVTQEDIFETLFGLEILDETDEIGNLQEYAREKWQIRAKDLGLENP